MSKKYIILKGEGRVHLEDLVELAMNEAGFVPVGGVIVLEDRSAYQAMIKETPDAKD